MTSREQKEPRPFGSKGQMSEQSGGNMEVNKEPKIFGSRNSGQYEIPDELQIVDDASVENEPLAGIEKLVKENEVDVLVDMANAGKIDSKLLVTFFTKCIADIYKKSTDFVKVADVLVKLRILKYSLAERFPGSETNRDRAASSQTDLAKSFYLLRKAFEIMRSESVEVVCDAMVRGELHPSIMKELLAAYKRPDFENKFLKDETLNQKFVEIKPYIESYEQMYKAEELVNQVDRSVEELALIMEQGSVPQEAFRLLLTSYHEGSRPDPFHRQALIADALNMI